jgi:hypothetical protein
MASILKVDTIQDQSGNNIINESADTITIGASGDTITVPSGATMTVPNGGLSGQNYPAFEADLSADQTITSGVNTKVTFDAELYDSDGCYDTSTNYRFTPTVAGKYWCYATVRSDGTSSTYNYMILSFFKNGSAYPDANRPFWRFLNNPIDDFTGTLGFTIDLNGSTDYVEVFTEIELSSGNPTLARGCSFGAYRIGA